MPGISHKRLSSTNIRTTTFSTESIQNVRQAFYRHFQACITVGFENILKRDCEETVANDALRRRLMILFKPTSCVCSSKGPSQKKGIWSMFSSEKNVEYLKKTMFQIPSDFQDFSAVKA
ncbi:hypothetical protein AVEN_18008-1 [Araneus ventricosus]|uniref:Uncharacterized protein n=1 Tax=Araneus ventricosus TaxID=182803 RepID=A0A4Y2U9J6_ARAVE|nr:hypothetical protein AVEN_18008-1 [Araneus ventricosus]